MKKIVFLCMIVLLGCEDSKISQYSSTTDETTPAPSFILYRHKHYYKKHKRKYALFNGFGWLGRAKAFSYTIFHENPHKIIFKETLPNGEIKYYVPKYAYCTDTSHDKTQFRFNCFWIFTEKKIHDATLKFQRPFRGNLKQEPYTLNSSQSNIWYDISDVVAFCDKGEYIQWMKQHPETIVLKD